MSTLLTHARHAARATIVAAGIALAAPALADSNQYAIRNLVSDVPGAAEQLDPDLVNPWGVAFNPNGFVWVVDNGTGKSTLYDGNGIKQALIVTIPSASGADPGTPTGITFNGTSDFRIAVAPGATPVVAPFIFVSEDGVISAWAPPLTTAQVVATNPAANYKGVAIAGDGVANHLYAADFVGRKIDVYTSTFAPSSVPGGFADPSIPPGYGPFNIMAFQGNLYVAYAKIGDEGDEVAGKGFGFVRVFDANGVLLKRLVSRGPLNAPWGMALAPAGFGRFSNRLLVGNFGDGMINAFDLKTGHFAGRLRFGKGKPEGIEGLWGIAFGPGVRNQPTDTLFFAAGIDDEEHGLYGRIEATEDEGENGGD
jgi:uncharacterized protein (TIGR03118 family)